MPRVPVPHFISLLARTLSLATLLAAGFASTAAAWTSMSAEELRVWQRQARPHLLVDTRSVEEFRNGHLKGAVHIPAFGIGRKRLAPSVPVIVYCNDLSGTTSLKAAKDLEAGGHRQVYLLDGGYDAWEFAGHEKVAPMGMIRNLLVSDVTAEDLVELTKARTRTTGNAVLIDLRKAEDFGKFQVPQSQNIPLLDGPAPQSGTRDSGHGASSADTRLLDLASGLSSTRDASAPVMVLMDDGSGVAMKQAEYLKQRGYRVRFLSGGIGAYKLLLQRAAQAAIPPASDPEATGGNGTDETNE